MVILLRIMNVPLSRKAKLSKLAFAEMAFIYLQKIFTFVKASCSGLGDGFALPSWSFEVASVKFPVQIFGFCSSPKFRIHVGKHETLWHNFVADQLPV
jgi:hypothetical protein